MNLSIWTDFFFFQNDSSGGGSGTSGWTDNSERKHAYISRDGCWWSSGLFQQVGDKWRHMVIHPLNVVSYQVKLFYRLSRGKSGVSWLWADEKNKIERVCGLWKPIGCFASKWRKRISCVCTLYKGILRVGYLSHSVSICPYHHITGTNGIWIIPIF